MYRSVYLAAALLTAVVLSGCNGGAKTANDPAVPTAPPKVSLPKSPDKYQVKFQTSKGDVVVDVTRAWAPNGADRFYQLVEQGFYDECRFFRVMPGFVVQWGINGDPIYQAPWRDATIPDDKVVETNARGTITFATSGANSRTTQVFINLGNNSNLDERGFSPFGQVTQGMDVVEAFNSKHGERPDQGLIQMRGNEFLARSYPDLDYIIKATIVKPDAAAAGSTTPAP